MKTVSVKIPASLEARLTATATRRGVSKSVVIRRALEREMSETRDGSSQSFLALAKDLAGCLAGPPDLSHHPKRLHGYGQ